MKQRLLFVINTLGRGGAETALLALLRRLDPEEYDVSLYVMLGQGELVSRLPEYVRLLNRRYDASDVLSRRGKGRLYRHLCGLLLRGGGVVRCLPETLAVRREMRRAGKVQPDKLLWRAIAESVPPLREEYDLAVAYLEGASTYYVASRVKARRKAAFVHTDFLRAGYTPTLDGDAYGAFGRIFCVSGETRSAFLRVHPECEEKTSVFENLLDEEGIRRQAEEPGGFSDSFTGFRILTVGRLVPLKALDLSIRAMALVKKEEPDTRWYVLGEGEERRSLEALIASLGLEKDFLLPGVTDAPYPYYRQADLYVHCSQYEGRSLAVREAMLLGCPVLLSDCAGNRAQITDGTDGLLTPLEPEAMAEAILRLIRDPELRTRLGANAARRDQSGGDLAELLGTEEIRA
jgi:glycosyltransferase involved in cell wall biosynthesis